MFKDLKRLAIVLSIALFLISLTQNCYCTAYGECDNGFSLFVFGWAGMYLGGPMLVWLANPFLVMAWVTLRRPNRASLIFSMLAAVTATSFLFFASIFEIDEGYSKIIHYMAGYWLWLVSCWAMMMANVAVLFKNRKGSITERIIHRSKLIKTSAYV